MTKVLKRVQRSQNHEEFSGVLDGISTFPIEVIPLFLKLLFSGNFAIILYSLEFGFLRAFFKEFSFIGLYPRATV
ncbi:hypothetical protein A7J08_06150 [Streptococcus suis]|uniref:Uncharacterized protein n=1 Tax=Streptococcus suis TaxID=1307 RepID=A0A3Q8B8E0_STRSU